MEIRFKKSPTAAPYLLAYDIGDTADIEDAIAHDLIAQDIAEPINPPHTKTATKPSDHTEKATSPQAKKAEKR